MTHVMMKITGWDRGDATARPQVRDVLKEFNLAAAEMDENFGVVWLGADQYAVMVTEEAKKKMVVRSEENEKAGRGPLVEGPFSNPAISGI